MLRGKLLYPVEYQVRKPHETSSFHLLFRVFYITFDFYLLLRTKSSRLLLALFASTPLYNILIRELYYNSLIINIFIRFTIELFKSAIIILNSSLILYYNIIRIRVFYISILSILVFFLIIIKSYYINNSFQLKIYNTILFINIYFNFLLLILNLFKSLILNILLAKNILIFSSSTLFFLIFYKNKNNSFLFFKLY